MPEQFDPYYTWLGIRPEEQPANHYRLLGLREFEDSAEAIQNSADRQMAHLRTFQAGRHADLSQKLLNEVAAARLCLLVCAKKAAYDAGLRQQLQPEGAAFEDLAAAIEPLGAAGMAHHVASKSATPWGTIVTTVAVLAVLAAGLVVWRGGPGKTEKNNASSQPLVEQTRPGATPVAIATAPPSTAPAPQGASATRPAANPVTAAKSAAPEPSAAVIAANASPADANVSKAVGRLAAATGRAFLAAAAGPAAVVAKPRPHLKLPAPAEEVQQSLLARMNDRVPSDGQANRRERIEWAKQLLHAAGQESTDPNQRFVLLRRATEVACSAGDVATVLEGVESMGRGFQIDVLDVEGKMLSRLISTAADVATVKGGIDAVNGLVEQVVERDRYELAAVILQEAYGACQNPQHAAFRKDLRARQAEIQKLAKQWEQVDAALVVLSQNDGDPPANLTVGRWFCFQKGRPDDGWPYLAKGSDEALKKLAAEELSPPADADDQARLGDAWLNVARLRYGDDKNWLLMRASFWYQQALDSSPAAATRARVEKRLDEIAHFGRPLGKNAPGRTAGNALRLHLRPGSSFPHDMWVDLLEYADMKSGEGKFYQSDVDPWRQTSDGIVGSKASGFLPLSVSINGDYDLETQFTRSKRYDVVFLTFLVGRRPCALALALGTGTRHRFLALNGRIDQSSKPNLTEVLPGTIVNDQRHTVLIQVRLMGDTASVEVRLDKKPLLNWAGPQAGVTIPWGWGDPPRPDRLTLVSFQPITFHSVRLRLLSGKAVVLKSGASPAVAGGEKVP
jgi:hypothetical protein